MSRNGERWLKILGPLFAVEVGWLAISPRDRKTWVLENLFVGALFAVWIPASRRIRLSSPSTVQIFAFLAVHEIGAHYTYSEVPYDAWIKARTGTSLNARLGWRRNHFDRMAHFLYGACCTDPIREVLLQTTPVRGARSYALPVAVSVASSVLYEMLEWGWAQVGSGDAVEHYLGQQGDEWDGTKDVALATAGALLAMTVRAAVDQTRTRASRLEAQ